VSLTETYETAPSVSSCTNPGDARDNYYTSRFHSLKQMISDQKLPLVLESNIPLWVPLLNNPNACNLDNYAPYTPSNALGKLSPSIYNYPSILTGHNSYTTMSPYTISEVPVMSSVRNEIKKEENINLLPLSNLGLNILGYGNDLYLHINQADKLLDILKAGMFVGDYTGKKIYSLNFYGNQYYKNTLVAAQKAEFLKHTKNLKVFKAAGVAGAAISLVPSTLEFAQERDVKSGFGLSFDLLLVGSVLLLTGVPALVIGGAALAISAYEFRTGNDVSDRVFDSILPLVENTGDWIMDKMVQ